MSRLGRLADRLLPATLAGRILLMLAAGALALGGSLGTAFFYMNTRAALLSDAYALGIDIAAAVRLAGRGGPDDAAAHPIAPAGLVVRMVPGPLEEFLFARPAQNLPVPEAVAELRGAEAVRVHLAAGSLAQAARTELLEAGTLARYFAVLSREVARLGVAAVLEVTLPDGARLMISAPGLWAERWRPSVVVLAGLIAAGLLVAVFAAGARALARPFADLAAAIARADEARPEAPLPVEGPVEARALASAHNALRDRISAVLAERTRMLAAISHDLRTPSTRLRLRAEFVEDGELQAAMLADLDEMDLLLAESLALLGDSVQREPERLVDFESLIEAIADDYADLGRPVMFCAPPPLTFRPVQTVFGTPADQDEVFFDRRRILVLCRAQGMKRAITNLIENALAYGRRARLHLDASAEMVEVRVEDEGPGIPEAEFANVLLPFYRLEASRARSTGGSGLGLAIVKSVVDAHGGRILLANRPEGGLEVTIRLPRAG
ncbi:ATP-binding protein [Segnochrobactraceae bacterium EtOH-i3]